MLRITDPSGDDWIVHVRFRDRRSGAMERRWLGVNGTTPESAIPRTVRNHISPPRWTKVTGGRELIDMEYARMSVWRARQLVEGAPPQYVGEVRHWSC